MSKITPDTPEQQKQTRREREAMLDRLMGGALRIKEQIEIEKEILQKVREVFCVPETMSDEDVRSLRNSTFTGRMIEFRIRVNLTLRCFYDSIVGK